MDPNGNTNKNIPEEILFEILTLLQVKSLSRFKCVSKHWFSVISDPNFVTAHLSRSKSRPKLLFSVTTGLDFPDKMSFYSIEYPKEDQPSGHLHATAHGSINPMKSWSTKGFSSTSASGLISCNCDQGIRIGNPITGEFNLIHHCMYDDDHLIESCYLGFDPIEKRDVVLQLDCRIQIIENIHLFSPSESRWHDIPPPQPFSYWPAKSAICINGVIYFTAIGNSYHICLCAFDVRLKCFEIIRCPPNPRFYHEFIRLLVEYKDRVALVCYEDGLTCKLWILEDQKKHSWSCKSFKVPWPRGDTDWSFRTKLCGATHRGELMFVTKLSTEGSLQLFLFEIDTNTLRRFQVDGFGPNELGSTYNSVQLWFLVESLHSPNKNKAIDQSLCN